MGDIFNFLCSEKMSPDNQNLVICKKGVLHKTFFTNNRYILICFPQVFFFITPVTHIKYILNLMIFKK